MTLLYNVYRRTNNVDNGLTKMNKVPMTREAAINLADYWQERAIKGNKYIVLRHRTNRGYVYESMRTY